MNTHTLEPWPSSESDNVENILFHEAVWKTSGNRVQLVVMRLIDYNRAKLCVDACAGMTNPGFEIARLEALTAALEDKLRVEKDRNASIEQQRAELQAKCDELHVQVHDFVAASSQFKDLWIELGKVVPEDYDGCMRLEGAMDKFCKIIVIAQAEAIAKVDEK